MRSFCVATQFLCCNKGVVLFSWFVSQHILCVVTGVANRVIEESYHDREFSIATGFPVFSVATEDPLSRQRWPILGSDQGVWGHDRVRLVGHVVAERARRSAQCMRNGHDSAPGVRALCIRQTLR